MEAVGQCLLKRAVLSKGEPRKDGCMKTELLKDITNNKEEVPPPLNGLAPVPPPLNGHAPVPPLHKLEFCLSPAQDRKFR
ncbi:hypothetical protein EK904_014641 [Melospiza melodia maxima]|nr:hypothetical protein EK904_014641 [Melospiza melodia maxima]